VTTTRGLFLVMSAALIARAALSPPPHFQPSGSAPSNSLRLVNDRRRKWLSQGAARGSMSAGLAASLAEERAKTRMAGPPSRKSV
jgi:hypothetical protein